MSDQAQVHSYQFDGSVACPDLEYEVTETEAVLLVHLSGKVVGNKTARKSSTVVETKIRVPENAFNVLDKDETLGWALSESRQSIEPYLYKTSGGASGAFDTVAKNELPSTMSFSLVMKQGVFKISFEQSLLRNLDAWNVASLLKTAIKRGVQTSIARQEKAFLAKPQVDKG